MDNEAQPTPAPPTKNPRLRLILLAVLLLVALGVGGGAFFLGSQGPEPTPTPTPTPTTQPTVTPSETPTPTPTKKPTPKPTATPTSTPTPTPTVTPTSTPTPVGFNVTGVTAAVAPTSSSTCPTTFNFSATITANGAGTVSYKWERSDPASPPTETVTFDNAGSKTVTSSWAIGAAGTHWKQVHILSPNDLTSNQATFTLTCP